MTCPLCKGDGYLLILPALADGEYMFPCWNCGLDMVSASGQPKSEVYEADTEILEYRKEDDCF